MTEPAQFPVKATSTASGFLPGVEGLRAIAILPVLLFHLTVPGFSLGWAGVNLFFVISGFLITGILVRTRGGQGYFRSFYARRGLRIWPIYYVSFLAVIAVALVRHIGISDWPHFVVYLQNYLLGWQSWRVGFPSFFSHTWSLAGEEQFYLIWPFLILLLSRRRLWLFVAAMFVVAPLSRYLAVSIDRPFLAFTALPTQVDAL